MFESSCFNEAWDVWAGIIENKLFFLVENQINGENSSHEWYGQIPPSHETLFDWFE